MGILKKLRFSTFKRCQRVWRFCLGVTFLMSMFGASMLEAKTFTLQEFFKEVEANSMELIGKKADFKSRLNEQRSINAWDFPYIENETSMVKNFQGIIEAQPRTLLVVRPKLPWVSSLLSKSLSIKTIQYDKSYQLNKNLAFIGAKRLYLTYVMTKEKYQVYVQREANFYSQLKIAKEKVKAGSMSEKDYINFKNSYLESKLAKTNVETKLIDLEKMLDTMLAIVEPVKEGAHFDTYLDHLHDVKVIGLDFEYVRLEPEALKFKLDRSLYVDILDLTAKDYQVNAKLANRDVFNEFEFGIGSESYNSSTNLSVEVRIPLPVTPKNIYQKRKFLDLQSGTLAQNEVMKRNIRINANSYLNQLKTKEAYIETQKEAIANKKRLMEMGRIAYEAQKIGLFEYLIYQNSYMDALITLAEAKIEYIDISALLEETLGESLTRLGVLH
ncbi:TolC family protein [Helicobacter pylori]|uniref:TolC family protein n=1 Tax=Helicobacter pylori TaxID=210 RepID=UPI001FD062DD|nr:TolC family protein [Helicobacter pylori]UOR78157.1 TolC family protein [Helicobacter pylori]